MKSPFILRAEGIELGFEGAGPLFRGLNIGLPRGGFIAVVGSSGSGKTSLLKVLGAFLRPDAGRVLLDGEPLKDPSPRAVMVFQEFDQLFPWKTVYANVAFPLRIRQQKKNSRTDLSGSGGISPRERGRIRERVSSILSEVGLAGREKYYPFQLSGGMKQRTALARALVSGASVLLMDEPFGSLDALRREELQGLLLRMWEEHGLSIVFVTHDISEALLLADTVLVLGQKGQRGMEGETRGEGACSFLTEVTVELPRPRSAVEPRFVEYYKKIYDLL